MDEDEEELGTLDGEKKLERKLVSLFLKLLIINWGSVGEEATNIQNIESVANLMDGWSRVCLKLWNFNHNIYNKRCLAHADACRLNQPPSDVINKRQSRASGWRKYRLKD